MLLEAVRSVATVLGDRTTAAEMMCGNAAYAEARARMGKPCTSAVSSKAPVVGSAAAGSTEVAKLPNGGQQYTDPYIRSRLALPPLK